MTTITIQIPIDVPDVVLHEDIPGYINSLLDVGLSDAKSTADDDGFSPCCRAKAEEIISLDIGQPEIVTTPRVLITVCGGVADYATSGKVDVALLDYDNEPDGMAPPGFEDLA